MIPLVDLVAQYHALKPEIDAALQQVLERGTFILGPQVAALEEEIAAYLGVGHAVGVASGTDALVLTMRAFGIGPGDEVIVPAYTFFATAEAVSQVGATPVFVDINAQTYCLDPDRLEAAVTPRTRAIIPVHLYGHPAEMPPILDLARRQDLVVIEDNAQAIGAEYRGRRTGSFGGAACLSFFPSKNLGAYGDGGMVVTPDAAVAQDVRQLRTHGWTAKYHPELVGYNSRLDELQAAVLRVKLRHLEDWTERRRAVARRYATLLADAGVQLPTEAPGVRHVHHLYTIRIAARERIRAHLASHQIGCSVYYPAPLHALIPYRTLVPAGVSFPESERAARETLAIPIYPEMTDAQVETVARAVREAVSLAQAR